MTRRLILAAVPLLLVVALAGAAEPGTPGVVNVNTADADQLTLLPRVGPALAARIIAFRESNGPFRSVDELLAVKGIGEGSLERLKPYLTLEGKSTLTEKVKLPRRTSTDAG